MRVECKIGMQLPVPIEYGPFAERQVAAASMAKLPQIRIE